MADTNSNPVARIFPHLEVENNNKSLGDEITELVQILQFVSKRQISLVVKVWKIIQRWDIR